jgi:hypothetical protein
VTAPRPASVSRGRGALADVLAPLAGGALGIVTGTVTAVPAPKVTVDVVGGVMTLPRFTWYTPIVGDVVIVLQSPTGWLVLGKIAT